MRVNFFECKYLLDSTLNYVYKTYEITSIRPPGHGVGKYTSTRHGVGKYTSTRHGGVTNRLRFVSVRGEVRFPPLVAIRYNPRIQPLHILFHLCHFKRIRNLFFRMNIKCFISPVKSPRWRFQIAWDILKWI